MPFFAQVKNADCILWASLQKQNSANKYINPLCYIIQGLPVATHTIPKFRMKETVNIQVFVHDWVKYVWFSDLISREYYDVTQQFLSCNNANLSRMIDRSNAKRVSY